MQVLVVEDDDLIVEFLRRSLRAENHDVDIAKDGQNGFQKALQRKFDVIILDVMLPMKNGLDICRDLREKKISTPILFLSARNSESARIQGLDAGADDYLIKPFSYRELNARLRALTRRPSVNLQPKIKCGPMELDSVRHEVTIDGSHIDLRAKEFELLELFMRNPRIVLTKQRLLKDIWDISPNTASNRLEVSIRNLRQKIDKEGEPSVIVTIRNKGYKLNL